METQPVFFLFRVFEIGLGWFGGWGSGRRGLCMGAYAHLFTAYGGFRLGSPFGRSGIGWDSEDRRRGVRVYGAVGRRHAERDASVGIDVNPPLEAGLFPLSFALGFSGRALGFAFGHPLPSFPPPGLWAPPSPFGCPATTNIVRFRDKQNHPVLPGRAAHAGAARSPVGGRGMPSPVSGGGNSRLGGRTGYSVSGSADGKENQGC